MPDESPSVHRTEPMGFWIPEDLREEPKRPKLRRTLPVGVPRLSDRPTRLAVARAVERTRAVVAASPPPAPSLAKSFCAEVGDEPEPYGLYALLTASPHDG